MKPLLIVCLLLQVLQGFGQKKEEWFDYSFKPAEKGAYYYVTTEKKDTVWQRQAYFIHTGSAYMEGSYLDEAGTTPHGVFRWYHDNKMEQKRGLYLNGKKEGVWLSFNTKGMITDSSNYTNGHLKGISLGWNDEGYPTDSSNFDGNGNGTQVSWYNGGQLASTGRWKQDTLKTGRWKYFHNNGQVLATEDYDDKGTLVVCNCYTEAGVALDTALCSEKEPKVNAVVWVRFLERNLQPVVEAAARKARPGQYTVPVRFIVEKDGKVSEVRTLTSYGYGIEEGIRRIMKNAPRWEPGRQHGQVVRSYHTQPITFVISN